MKFVLVGYHSSGKQEVLDLLEQKGVKCGHLFSNIEDPSPEVYNSNNFELYTTPEVHNLFENNSYIFLHSLECKSNINSYKYYEGLSFYDFDNNDVFALSPDQVIDIPQNTDKSDICYVWMDNTTPNRISRYKSEKRSYNFIERDTIEKRGMEIFAKEIYNRPVLYFTNEEPERIATVLYAIIKHPDLLDEFLNNFN